MARIIKAVEGELVFGRKVSLLSECGLEAVELRKSSDDELSFAARDLESVRATIRLVPTTRNSRER